VNWWFQAKCQVEPLGCGWIERPWSPVCRQNLWGKLHGVYLGLILLTVDCCVRTVPGALVSVRPRLVLKVELAGQYYVGRFMVWDVVDCDWKRGVLCLLG
jgi:hypothetical protein